MQAFTVWRSFSLLRMFMRVRITMTILIRLFIIATFVLPSCPGKTAQPRYLKLLHSFSQYMSNTSYLVFG